MGIEILYNPYDYMSNLNSLPVIKQYGRKRDRTSTMEWGIEIITKKKRIKIFYQKKCK